MSPDLILSLLRRRGMLRPEHLRQLHLVHPIDLVQTKIKWLAMLDQAADFICARPPSEVGCLYHQGGHFFAPTPDQAAQTHFGVLGGSDPSGI